jgi:hypothetical protein
MRVDLLVPSLRFRIRVRSTIYHSSDGWETSEFPPTDQLNGCDDPAAVGLTPYPNLFFLFRSKLRAGSGSCSYGYSRSKCRTCLDCISYERADVGLFRGETI